MITFPRITDPFHQNMHGEVKTCRLANVVYLRYQRTYVLLATPGEHENFFSKDYEKGEGSRLKDLRREPLVFAGYALSFQGGHAVTRIADKQYKLIHSYFLERAFLWSTKRFVKEFRRLSYEFEPYKGVLLQLHGLRAAINKCRQTQGLETIPETCIRRYRTRYDPFGTQEEKDAA